METLFRFNLLREANKSPDEINPIDLTANTQFQNDAAAIPNGAARKRQLRALAQAFIGSARFAKSAEIIMSLNYDITKAKVSNTARLGVCLRTVIIDDIVKNFIKLHPDGTIVNLGCGLDTRFSRLDNEKSDWFDLDLPDTISLRRLFLQRQNETVSLQNLSLIFRG